MSRAAVQELELTPDHKVVSGDGTWHTPGFKSLHGVSTLLGYKTGKVLDLEVLSTHCTECLRWESKSGTAEYEEWLEDHIYNCEANFEGSAGNMAVRGILTCFQRSEELHGIKYHYYLGDGDSKTFKTILTQSPYEDVVVQKKECVGHIQKRMGTQLRELKKSWGKRPPSDNKSIGGRGRVTGDVIDQLTVYYGNAIRGHSDSVDKMYDAIWATFYHKGSTDDKPEHDLCPRGETSWCSWQRAKAADLLEDYEHKNTLPPAVMEVIKPVYTKLADKALLEKCLGGFTQNQNESLNSKIWRIAPKKLFMGTPIIEIAAYMAAAAFNDGAGQTLHLMELCGIKVGERAKAEAVIQDQKRITKAEKKQQDTTKEARRASREKRIADHEAAVAQEGSTYAPGGF